MGYLVFADTKCFRCLLRYPKDILVRDSGMDMMVFRRKTEEELANENDVNAEIKEEIKVD